MNFKISDPIRFAHYGAVIGTVFLIGVLLLPQGVGIRHSLSLPRLDLPRMSMFAMLVTASVFFILNPRRFSFFQVAPRTIALFVFIFIWQMISAFMAGSGIWSYYWAFGNLISFWGFTAAFLMLAGDQKYRHMVVHALIVIAVILALWSALEFITQAKLVTNRNLYVGDPSARGFSYFMRRGIHGVGLFPYMSLGPYFIHHILAAVLCALGGFLILGPDKRGALWYFLGSLLLTFAIFSTQSRTGIVAYAALLTIGLYLHETWRSRFAVTGGVVVGLLLFIELFGGAEDFATAFFHNILGNTSILEIYNKIRAGGVTESFLQDHGTTGGTAEGRLAGLAILLSQIDQWWLFGTGPGSMFNQERILPRITGYSEQGSFIWMVVESGLPVGIALAVCMGKSIYQGFCSQDWRAKSAAVGVCGFWIFGLIHVALQSWVIGMVLAGLIEAWSRPEKTDQRPDGASLTTSLNR